MLNSFFVTELPYNDKLRRAELVMELHPRAVGRHLPRAIWYHIGTSKHTPTTQAGTRFSYPGWMEAELT